MCILTKRIEKINREPAPELDVDLDDEFDPRLPIGGIPTTRAGVYRAFGDPKFVESRGKIKVSRAWEREHCHVIRDLPGYGRKLYVHRLMGEYLVEGLRRALVACPEYIPARIGCFNPRRMRWPGAPYSYHSWAIAIDVVSPGQTRAKRVDPDMPEAFGAALESVGFRWGRRWKRRDDMHFQLCGKPTEGRDPVWHK